MLSLVPLFSLLGVSTKLSFVPEKIITGVLKAYACLSRPKGTFKGGCNGGGRILDKGLPEFSLFSSNIIFYLFFTYVIG